MELDRNTKEQINNKLNSIGLDPVESARDAIPDEESINTLKFRLSRLPVGVKGVPNYILRNALNKKIIEDSNGAASLYTIELDSEASKLGTNPELVESNSQFDTRMPIDPSRYYILEMNPDSGRLSVTDNKLGYETKDQAIEFKYRNPKQYKTKVNKGSTILHRSPDRYKVMLESNFSRFETNEQDDKIMVPATLLGQSMAAGTREFLGRKFPDKVTDSLLIKSARNLGRTIPSVAVGAGVGYGSFITGKKLVNLYHNKDNKKYMETVTKVNPEKYYVLDVVNEDYFTLLPGVTFDSLAEGNYFVAASHRKPKGQFECHKGSVLIREFPKRFVI